jgi:hypothetical protein
MDTNISRYSKIKCPQCRLESTPFMSQLTNDMLRDQRLFELICENVAQKLYNRATAAVVQHGA